jgi:hypothetical protein
MKTSIARWVSLIGHPFVMIVLMAGSIAAYGGASDDAPGIAIVVLYVVIPVAILTMHQVHRGVWANADASNPRDRPVLYSVGIAGVFAVVLHLILTRPDSILMRGSVVALILLLACAAITRWIKISLHMAAAALTAMGLILLGSPIGWFVAGFVPILGWSRSALGRHKPVELVLGLGFGIIAGVAMRFP